MAFLPALKYVMWGLAGFAAALRPAVGAPFFSKLEELGGRVARRPAVVFLGLGLVVLLTRAALLPFWPVPKPVIYDEFAYLLQADTFAHGRFTNSTHKLWQFFESPYVLQHPTYAAKYPPGHALAMAAGQVVFQDPWFGVWLSCGFMAGALVWAMQGWLPPDWSLIGGLLALPLAINSYWMNSYWGGAVAAVGGALLLGGYARVVSRRQPGYALAMGLGLAILANTRPYEGLVFAVPVMIALFLPRPRWKALALITVILVPAFALSAWYNHAVTGDALQLPFTEYARQYARIPIFNFQSLHQGGTYSNSVMADLHQKWEPAQWLAARSLQLLPDRLTDWQRIVSTLLGSVLFGLLILGFLRNLSRDRRIRLPLICLGAMLAGSLIEVRYYDHYFGPATAALLIVTVQALRHLRQWQPGRRLAGRFLSRAIPVLVGGMAIANQGAVILRQEPPENSQPRNALRDRVAAKLLDDQLGQHVILVRYSGNQSPHEEWVYNTADIDRQDVVWAHDLGATANAALMEYYKGRKIWLFQPDINPTQLNPYP